MIHEVTGAAAVTAVVSAAAIDFGLLNELPKGALVGCLTLSLTVIGILARREFKRRDDKDNEQQTKIDELHDRLVVAETLLGTRGRRKEDKPGESERAP